MKSLKAEGSQLAEVAEQLHILEDNILLTPFQQKLEESGLYPLKPLPTAIFQVNIGKMCNQVCRHCHVDAGPDRKE
ncbi:MAG: radical SAM protein, partial [Hymenobacter sp.]